MDTLYGTSRIGGFGEIISKRHAWLRSGRAILQAFVLALIIEASGGSANAECATTLTDVLGSKVVNKIKDTIESAAADFRPAGNVVPKELAYTVSETLPLLRKADFLNPVWPGARIYVDAYYGTDFATSSPDYQILPADESLLCSLSPGRAVFLSDTQTHHYAIIYAIDYRSRTVTLLDPWAPVSFLLAGHNVADVKAKAYLSKKGQPLLDLSFQEFLRVVRGAVEEFNPEATFRTFEVLHPELVRKEDYLFWKYSRLISTNSWQRSLLPAMELSNLPDLGSMPKLALLAHWANDYIVGVESRFTIPEPRKVAKEADLPKLREAYFGRLVAYAEYLPWSQKWLLLNRAQKSGDKDLYAATLNSFVTATPTDVDLQLRRTNFLLQAGRIDDAEAQLVQARKQWKLDVVSAVATSSPDESVAFLFNKDYGLQSLAVLHWRNVRLQLAERQIALKRNPTSAADHDLAMSRIQSNYVISSVLLDFFPDVLRDAYLSHAHQAEEAYIKVVSQTPDDERRIKIFARALYEHFNQFEDISGLSPATSDLLRWSSLGLELCGLSRTFKPRTFTGLTHAFAKFCWPKAFTLEGRWSTDLGERCSSQFLDLQVSDSTTLEIRDQAGRTRSEWILDQGRIGSDSVVVTQLQSSQFTSGPFRNPSPKVPPTYNTPDPEEGFPVQLEASQFESGAFEVREQRRFYRIRSDRQLDLLDDPSSSRGLKLVRCTKENPLRSDSLALPVLEKQKSSSALVKDMPPERRNLIQKAVEVGADTSRHRAYCGSFFAFSVDSELPSGEYIQIRTPSGFAN